MTKRSPKMQKTQTKMQDLVVVASVGDLDQGKDYETLLKNNNIPAVIKKQNNESANAEGFVVMVPEDFLDEAHVVIESQDAYDDFYDLALEDEESDFDSELFDDEL